MPPLRDSKTLPTKIRDSSLAFLASAGNFQTRYGNFIDVSANHGCVESAASVGISPHGSHQQFPTPDSSDQTIQDKQKRTNTIVLVLQYPLPRDKLAD
ncbi:hypothetical protein EUGRSUZ_B02384 [Eucalyptus grandis]|uniref:Uncharacterized protein n=2 Tax=Eucalyptus grandis TaxID=71139 RepID=A0ACC3LT05_EUCGR|nr:hypothetical protein EUGRSUZ_B02384 [Eucalyptus grandis]